jgi:hypothetical protein
MEPLNELLSRAQKARDSSGPQAIADRLILFFRVVSALEQFVRREIKMIECLRLVRLFSKRLDGELRNIELTISHNGPDEEHVRKYYAAVIELRRSLKSMEEAAQAITIYDRGQDR